METTLSNLQAHRICEHVSEEGLLGILQLTCDNLFLSVTVHM